MEGICKVWLGFDETAHSTEEHDTISAPFVFGCQISEKGLFQSQYADGIMGLSMYAQTLVDTGAQSGSIDYRSFSLCLNHEGGAHRIGWDGIESRATRAEPFSGLYHKVQCRN